MQYNGTVVYIYGRRAKTVNWEFGFAITQYGKRWVGRFRDMAENFWGIEHMDRCPTVNNDMNLIWRRSTSTTGICYNTYRVVGNGIISSVIGIDLIIIMDEVNVFNVIIKFRDGHPTCQ